MRRRAIKRVSNEGRFLTKSNLCKRLLIFDMYAKPFDLVLPDDTNVYKTLCGSILSLITITTIALYAVFKSASVMIDPVFKI